MKGRIRSQHDSVARFSNFLKPGALAQIRDFKITARSRRLTRRLRLSQSLTTSQPSMSAPSLQIANVDCLEQLARFSSPNYGPQRFGRKKLLAAKSSVHVIGLSVASPGLDSGNNDLLVH